jgi:hypothetical protein
MKNSFAPIFTSMLDSSIWQEPYTVRLLWTAMLALKDSDHIVRLNAFQLSRRANLTEQEVIDGLKILESPDTKRLEPQPFDGRRIERVPDGWLILNGQRFEDMMRTISRRAYNARKQRQYRESTRTRKATAESGRERRYVKAIERGDQVTADFIAAEGLPTQLEQDFPVDEQPTSNHPEIPELE